MPVISSSELVLARCLALFCARNITVSVALSIHLRVFTYVRTESVFYI